MNRILIDIFHFSILPMIIIGYSWDINGILSLDIYILCFFPHVPHQCNIIDIWLVVSNIFNFSRYWEE